MAKKRKLKKISAIRKHQERKLKKISLTIRKHQERIQKEIKHRKKHFKWITAIIGVIVVPFVLSILLAAFEDTTNEWMMRLRGNEPVVDQTKRLAENGQLIHQECAALGMKVQEVLENCSQPVYRLTEYQTEKPYERFQELRTKGPEKREFIYTFSDETLVAMEVVDPAWKSIPFSKVKETFEDVENTGLEQTDQYSYSVSADHYLTFLYDSDTKELHSIRLEARQPPQKENQPFATLTRRHQVEGEKDVQSGGLRAVQRMQPLVQAGDLLDYDCGPLGTDYRKVINQCGEQVIRDERDMENEQRRVRYEYSNRRITLTFHQDQLSQVDVEQKEAPWAIDVDEVKRVFGDPVKTENHGKTFFYYVKPNVVRFSFTEEDQLTQMTVADEQHLKWDAQTKSEDEMDLIY